MSERIIGYRVVGKVTVNPWHRVSDERKLEYAKEFAEEFVKQAERHIDDVNPKCDYGTFITLEVEPVYEEVDV